ncbi:MAG: protein kinase, partial [Thermoanaerobaculia bacterium]
MSGTVIGTRLGPYEITGKLGEGGMGEVYRATDSHLKREVAIKVLPAAFTEDKERLARFEREAQLLAQLNHPNIAQIYGLEKSGETRALVMELVPGPTLDERLATGPLPLTESLSIALQVALALEEAHEKGIVHRDLKPQNIKASGEGKVKVLDFGLAKAMDPAGAPSSAGDLARSPTLMNSPTLTAVGTQLGTILGTAAYMSPEQAKGKAVDKRADIWAFGVVLWEMLTGKRLFEAESVPETLAAIFSRDLSLATLPVPTPPAVRQLLARCLERDPRRRLRDIGEARLALESLLALGDAPAGHVEELAAPGASGLSAGALGRRRWPWLGGALVGLLAGGIGGMAVARFASSQALSTAGDATMQTLVSGGPSEFPSLAPDGKTLAFSSLRNDEERIWIKDLVSGSESALGRDPSSRPVFSPDGTSILFETHEGVRNDLYRIALATREERLVARDALRGDWSPDGRSVLFLRRPAGAGAAPQAESEILSIDLGSGQERSLFRGEIATSGSVFPKWSPDGRSIAIGVVEGQAGIASRVGLLDPQSGRLEQFPIRLPHIAVSRVRGMDWISNRRLVLLLEDGGGYLGSSGRLA